MTKLVVTIGFFVAFAAGLTVGMTRARHGEGGASSTTQPARGHGNGGGGGGGGSRGGHRGGTPWLVSELNLTPEQAQAMEKIWSETARRGRSEMDDRRRQLRKERDEAIANLVPPADKPRYDQVLKNYQDQQQAMEKETRGNFDKAVALTKELLTPEQRAKYEELLSKHQFRGPGGPGGPDRDRGGSDRDRNHDLGERRSGPPTQPAGPDADKAT
ncbi:MAG TPA: Spy/CpxP family protein refolding chaperone [Tepidisphaeraceae bacterium]|nr:Spy/CpxP family protein refolding chaperone [Tepidisphaeraceae bacterium]